MTRRIQVLTLGVLLAVTAGCTASRSVDAWRDGWTLEQKGESTLALRKYTDATSRLGKYTGAMLNRIRLMSAVPERRADAQELLDKLVKSEASDARVAAFAAMWALWQGDVALARTRLAAGALKADDQDDTVAAFHQAQLAVLMAEKQWQSAWREAKAMAPMTPQDHLRMATLAWNGYLRQGGFYRVPEIPFLPQARQLLRPSPQETTCHPHEPENLNSCPQSVFASESFPNQDPGTRQFRHRTRKTQDHRVSRPWERMALE